MKKNSVLHTGSLDVKTGGPALSTYLAIKGLEENGVKAEMLMPPLNSNGRLIADDVKVYYTEKTRNSRFGYMPDLRKTLTKLPVYDIYHIQGIWQYLGHRVAAYARRADKPYIISLRGMLYPQALAHSALIKKISLKLYQADDLKHAACIHATCREEMNYYRKLGFTNPVAVIPNPVDYREEPGRSMVVNEKFRIGYLGRLHPRKRIERLIYAFSDLRNELRDAELVIIGADDAGYEQFLRDEVKRLHLDNVVFTGFLTGKEKDDALQSLSFLTVVSDFENFGNIVTEALARGIPVIASKGMPWQELESFKCGWWIDNSQKSINKTILEAFHTSPEYRKKMGANARQLIADRYTVEVVGRKLKQLYEWILNGGGKPEFVYE